jgi:hypothetical protein
LLDALDRASSGKNGRSILGRKNINLAICQSSFMQSIVENIVENIVERTFGDLCIKEKCK